MREEEARRNQLRALKEGTEMKLLIDESFIHCIALVLTGAQETP